MTLQSLYIFFNAGKCVAFLALTGMGDIIYMAMAEISPSKAEGGLTYVNQAFKLARSC